MTGIPWTRWQILSPLLDELLELDPSRRTDRLTEIRRDDGRLADELGALLAEEGAVDREAFLEGSALSGEAALAGRIVGSYTLDNLLGQGGMGSVWLAHRSDGRFAGRVAVKFLNLALVAGSGAERFRREGSILAKLAHPNIARLLDAGVAEGGQPYLVLELVEGQPIDRYCDTHELGIEARIRLFLDVLAAVESAHRNLILHRDLKPSNILVTGDGQVKLLDFGIAKLLGEPVEATALAGRAFTPEYAAPEQVEGKEVTTATDVYALGVLLYLLLAGEHPTAVATQTPVERLRAVVETEPDRLSTAAGRLTRTGAGAPLAPQADRSRAAKARALRGDLDTIAAKALKKSPHERYATVAAFADDLRRYLNDEPVLARPDSRAYRIGKFVRRHRLGVGAASATLLALIAGVIGTTWQAFEARRERDAALFQAERALAKSNFVDLLLGALGDADRPLTQREILGRGVDLVEKQYGSRPRIAIDLLLPIAGHYMSLGDAEKELDAMQRAARHAAALRGPRSDRRRRLQYRGHAGPPKPIGSRRRRARGRAFRAGRSSESRSGHRHCLPAGRDRGRPRQGRPGSRDRARARGACACRTQRSHQGQRLPDVAVVSPDSVPTTRRPGGKSRGDAAPGAAGRGDGTHKHRRLPAEPLQRGEHPDRRGRVPGGLGRQSIHCCHGGAPPPTASRRRGSMSFGANCCCDSKTHRVRSGC